MSIIDNLLVLLDDGNKLTVEDIKRSFPEYSKQIISATLGRVASKHFVKKNDKYYKIDSIGQTTITQNLNRIKLFERRPESKNLLFVMFNIPEKERLYRDILRNYLTQNGFGRLHNTVWISFHHKKEDLDDLLSELKIIEKILIYESKILEQNLETLIRHANWNMLQINKKYKTFIAQTSNFFQTKSKSNIMARCMVYEFAKIVSYDPILPLKYLDNKYEGLKAFAMCQKLRKYCY